ncbi:hypothetical protein HMPREF1544_08561 [Mucor circinelloides 1006PhL]|uniref:Box C/D snoRNA protein 1 n=1 Tax=Mucor circinelloides f. circinelloides (strain 1006PhL) TaxID=1220926 RepID=S2JPZ2_MUCC1|nr:hypothetical protein HMPREF1544_08561 [Mucor circinelloides 1006PhL]
MSTDDQSKDIELALQKESGITLIKEDRVEDPAPIPQLTEEEIKKAKLCQICQEKDWIYTCPRCLTHTCSLKCVKQHKKEAPCSGERDKTAYVPLQKYTETHMMSDYTYLEDVSRQSDNITRSRMETNRDLKVKSAENRAKAFSKVANQLGIHYSSLPVGMSRNKLNQSNYSKNLKQIFWSIEVNFCFNGKKERYLEHSFPQIKPFSAFFENLLLAENPQGRGAYSTIRHQVKLFIDAGIDQFNIALKKEKSPRGHFVNVTHQINHIFKDVLKGEQIIEYPIFYVWLKSQEQPSDILVLKDKKQPLITTLHSEHEKAEEDVVEHKSVEEAGLDEVEGTVTEAVDETNNVLVDAIEKEEEEEE